MKNDPFEIFKSQVNLPLEFRYDLLWEFLHLLTTGIIVAGLLAILLYLLWGLWLEIKFLRNMPTTSDIRSRLRQVRKKALTNDGLHPTIKELNSKKVGLVLSGGGAKGAYEIGAIRALQHLGLKNYHAIAGTSVGALNGVLIAQDDLDEALKIWRNMSFGKVLDLSDSDTSASGSWPLIKLFRILLAGIRFVIAVVARLILAPFFIFRNNTPTWLNALRCKRYFSAIASPEIEENRKIISEGLAKIIVGVICACVLLAFFVPVMGWQNFLNSHLIEIIGQDWIIPLFLFYLAFIWLTLSDFHNTVAAKLALFSNTPLQDMVREKVVKAKLDKTGIRTFITQAYRAGIIQYDISTPDNEVSTATTTEEPKSWFSKHIIGEQKVRLSPIIKKSVGHVTRYINLNDQTEEDMERDVVQSAGLPEIFPLKSIHGEMVVDGGMADNTPILPILQQDEIGNIVVIYLDKPEALEKRLAKEVIRLEKLADSLAVSLEEFEKEAESVLFQKLNAKVSSRKPVSCRLLPIIPSLHLGNMANGTMMFSSKRSRLLIRLGYWDTLKALENGMHDLKLDVKPSIMNEYSEQFKSF